MRRYFLTDEAFWIRFENEVMPHVREKHSKYINKFESKLARIKGFSNESIPAMVHHEWISLACYLRNFYWEGLTIKPLMEFCCNKAGEPFERMKFE
jgi:hypothetical protein